MVIYISRDQRSIEGGREGESLKDSGGQCSVTSSDEDEVEPIEQMGFSLVSISWIGIRLGRVCSIPRFDIPPLGGESLEREKRLSRARCAKCSWLKVNEGLTAADNRISPPVSFVTIDEIGDLLNGEKPRRRSRRCSLVSFLFFFLRKRCSLVKPLSYRGNVYDD